MAGRFGSFGMGRNVPQSNDLYLEAPDSLPRVFSQHDFGRSSAVALPTSHEHGKADFLHNICAECPYVSSTKGDLEQHASSSGHTPFSCICGAQFSRASTLTRHINSMIGPSFQCGLCDERSFPRLDKLGDHLRKWHRLGERAFDQYKSGSSSCGPASLPSGRNPPVPSEDAAQFYPRQLCSVAPGFGPVPMFNGFPIVSNTRPDTSSGKSSASPGNSTAADDWLYSQLGNNEAYPPSM